jgi:hypothetical protein
VLALSTFVDLDPAPSQKPRLSPVTRLDRAES